MSKEVMVSAKAPKVGKEGSITIQAPETIEEAIQMYGGEAVLTNAMANFVIKLQGNVRSALEKGETAEAMQTRLGGSKMGVAITKSVGLSPEAAKAAYLAQFKAADPELRKQMLAELKAEAQAA